MNDDLKKMQYENLVDDATEQTPEDFLTAYNYVKETGASSEYAMGNIGIIKKMNSALKKQPQIEIMDFAIRHPDLVKYIGTQELAPKLLEKMERMQKMFAKKKKRAVQSPEESEPTKYQDQILYDGEYDEEARDAFIKSTMTDEELGKLPQTEDSSPLAEALSAGGVPFVGGEVYLQSRPAIPKMDYEAFDRNIQQYNLEWSKQYFQKNGGKMTPEDLNNVEGAKTILNQASARSWTGDANLRDALKKYGNNPVTRAAIADYAFKLYAKESNILMLLDKEAPYWRDRSSDEQAQIIGNIAAKYGIDSSNLFLNRLKERGIADVELKELTNLFGIPESMTKTLTDKYSRIRESNFITLFRGQDNFAYGDVSKYSDVAALQRVGSAYMEQLDALRGETFGQQVAQGTVESLRFVLEFAILNSMLPGVAGIETLAQAGFTGGFKNYFKNIATKKGLQAVAQYLGEQGFAQAINLGNPLSLYGTYNEAVDASMARPDYIFYDENGVEVEISEENRTNFLTEFGRGLISTYIDRYSEGMGEILPQLKVMELLPVKVQERMILAAAKSTSNPLDYLQRFLRKGGVQGFGGELAEEYIAKIAKAAVTDFGEWSGAGVLDLGEDSYLGSWEEFGLTFSVIALQNAIMGGGQFALRKASGVDVRSANAVASEVIELAEECGFKSEQTRTLLEGTLQQISGGEYVGVLSADESLLNLVVSNKEFFDLIGITESAVRESIASGEVMEIDLARVTALQTESEVNRSIGDTLKSMIETQQNAEIEAESGVGSSGNIDIDVVGEVKRLQLKQTLSDRIGERIQQVALEHPEAKIDSETTGALFSSVIDLITKNFTGKNIEATVDELFEKYMADPVAFESAWNRPQINTVNELLDTKQIGDTASIKALSSALGVNIKVGNAEFWKEISDKRKAEYDKNRSEAEAKASKYRADAKQFEDEAKALEKEGKIAEANEKIELARQAEDNAEKQEARAASFLNPSKVRGVTINKGNGVVEVYINPEAAGDAIYNVFGDELIHYLKATNIEVYNSLRNAIVEGGNVLEGEQTPGMARALQKWKSLYPELLNEDGSITEDFIEEAVSHVLGEVLSDFQTQLDLANALEAKKEGMGRTFLESVLDTILKVLRWLGNLGGDKTQALFREYDKVRMQIVKTLADYAEIQNGLIETTVTTKAVEATEAPELSTTFGVKELSADNKPVIADSDPQWLKEAKERGLTFKAWHPNQVQSPEGGIIAIVDIASGDVLFSGDEGYKASWQPRYETMGRKRRKRQISKIARNPHAEQFFTIDSTDAGTPIIAESDGKFHTVAGNGRGKALRLMYSKYNTADRYKAMLKQWASQNGLAFDESMQMPVLVRVLPENMTDSEVAEFAGFAKGLRTLQATSSESLLQRANELYNDSEMLSMLHDSPDGDLLTAENMPFFMKFLERYGSIEGDLDEQGLPTKAVSLRIQKALLAMLFLNEDKGQALRTVFALTGSKAYDLGITRIVNGVSANMVKVLDVRRKYPEYDISTELGEALRALLDYSAHKKYYSSPEMFVMQMSLDGKMLPESVQAVFIALANSTSYADVNALFTQWAETVDTEMTGMSELLGERLTKEQLLENRLDSYKKENADKFRLNVAEDNARYSVAEEEGSPIRTIGRGVFNMPGNSMGENYKAVLDALHNYGIEPSKVFSRVAPLVRALARDFVEKYPDLTSNNLAEQLKIVEDWATSKEDADAEFATAFENFMIDDTLPEGEGQKDLLLGFSGLRNVLLSVYSNSKAMAVIDGDVRAILDSYLYAEEAVNHTIQFDSLINTLGVLAKEGIAGDSSTWDMIHIAEKARAAAIQEQGKLIKKATLETRKRAKKQAEEYTANHPVYVFSDRIKALGGFNREVMIKLIGQKNVTSLRLLGLMAKKDAEGISPLSPEVTELIEKYGIGNDLASTFDNIIAMGKKSAFMNSLVENAMQRWIAAQEWNGDANVLSNAEVIKGLDTIARTLVQEGAYAEAREMFQQEVKDRLSKMTVKDILNNKIHISSAKSLLKSLTKELGRAKENKADVLIYMGRLRRQMEMVRQIEGFRKDIRNVVNKLARGARMKKGRIYDKYHDAIKELVYIFGLTSSKTQPGDLKARQIVYKEYLNECAELEITPTHFPDFLFSMVRKDFKGLTYGEAKALHDFGNWLYGEGRDKVRELNNSRAERIHKILKSVIEEFKKLKHNHSDYKDKSGVEKTFAVMNRLRSKFTLLWRLMGEAGNTMDYLYKILTIASSLELELQTRALKPLTESINRLYDIMQKKDYEKNKALPSFGDDVQSYRRWTKEYMIMAVLYMGTDSSKQRLRDGFGWLGEVLDMDSDLRKIAESLPAAALKEINNIWKIMSAGELTQMTKETFLRENHYELQTLDPVPMDVRSVDGEMVHLTGGYIPLRYLYSNRRENLQMGFTPLPLLAQPSGTFDRCAILQNTAPLRLSIGTLIADISDRAHYATHTSVLKEIFAVVTDPKFREEFGKTQGFERYDTMMDMLRHVANPARNARDAIGEWEKWAKSIMVGKALMLNLSSAGMQLTGLTIGARELGKYWIKSFINIIAHPLDSIELAREKSAMMRQRQNMQDIDLHAATSKFSGNKLSKARTKFEGFAYSMMRAIDVRVAAIGFNAAYAKALDKGLSERAAIAEAENFVAKTQGSTRSIDLMPFQLNTMGRILTPFITACAAQANVTAHDLMDPNSKAWDKVVSLMLNAIIPMALAASLRFVMKGGFSDDDEQRKDATLAAFQEMMTQPFAGIPIIRDVVDLGVNVMTGGPLQGGLDVGMLGAVNDIFMNTFHSLKEATTKGDWDYAGYLMCDAISQAMGMPVLTIYERYCRIFEDWGFDVYNAREELNDAEGR